MFFGLSCPTGTFARSQHTHSFEECSKLWKMRFAAENSVLQVFGAHQRTRQITASKYGGLSTTVPPGKAIEPGMPTVLLRPY